MATKSQKSKFDYKEIKTYEDACKKEGIDSNNLPDVSMIPEEFRKPLISVFKLFVIFKAINNGWMPDWSNVSQWKYYPWFFVSSSGFGFQFSTYRYTDTFSFVSSRLCTNTSEKALYIASQFEELYKDFFLFSK